MARPGGPPGRPARYSPWRERAGPGARPAGGRGQGPVGLRLALAFVAVAVLAVALVAVLSVAFADKDIAVLVQQRRDD